MDDIALALEKGPSTIRNKEKIKFALLLS